MESITLSPLALFIQAGLVGKSVMIVLLVASIWCWLLILEGWLAAHTLKIATRRAGSGEVRPPLQLVFLAGQAARAKTIAGEGVGERRQRLAEAMNRAARQTIRDADSGLPMLAIIASVTPFIGLLGTVWGIMASFVGIAESRDTSLAVVAPGIAEALAATAFGLAAAIPASIGYNKLAASIGRTSQAMGDVIEAYAEDLVVEESASKPGMN
jgi:biopolymer transport protein ExbB/TolQ